MNSWWSKHVGDKFELGLPGERPDGAAGGEATETVDTLDNEHVDTNMTAGTETAGSRDTDTLEPREAQETSETAGMLETGAVAPTPPVDVSEPDDFTESAVETAVVDIPFRSGSGRTPYGGELEDIPLGLGSAW